MTVKKIEKQLQQDKRMATFNPSPDYVDLRGTDGGDNSCDSRCQQLVAWSAITSIRNSK